MDEAARLCLLVFDVFGNQFIRIFVGEELRYFGLQRWSEHFNLKLRRKFINGAIGFEEVAEACENGRFRVHHRTVKVEEEQGLH